MCHLFQSGEYSNILKCSCFTDLIKKKSASKTFRRIKAYLHFNSIGLILNYCVCIISEIFTIEIQYYSVLPKLILYINLECAYVLYFVTKIRYILTRLQGFQIFFHRNSEKYESGIWQVTAHIGAKSHFPVPYHLHRSNVSHIVSWIFELKIFLFILFQCLHRCFLFITLE